MAVQANEVSGMVSFAAIKGFLGGVPREVYYALAAVVLLLGYGQVQYNKGKDVILERLEEAQREARLLAEEAMNEADSEAEKRAIAHAVTQSTLTKVIQDAQRDNSNPIDALIGSLRPEAD